MDIEVTSEEDCPFNQDDSMPLVCKATETDRILFCGWDKESCPLYRGETVVVKKK